MVNLNLKGLVLDSFGKRCISLDFPREREQEVVEALATVGVALESRRNNR